MQQPTRNQPGLHAPQTQVAFSVLVDTNAAAFGEKGISNAPHNEEEIEELDARSSANIIKLCNTQTSLLIYLQVHVMCATNQKQAR